jgi:hypothetical protein
LLIADVDGHQSLPFSQCAFETQVRFLRDPSSLPTTFCPNDMVRRQPLGMSGSSACARSSEEIGMVGRFYSALVLILVMSLLVIGQVASVAAQDATPTAAEDAGEGGRTDVRYVLPFTPDGLNPGLTAASTEEGVCGFASSAALERPDAWDCTGAEGQIYDPCFENPFIPPDEPAQVACVDTPFTTDVVVLTLTESLVRQKEAPDAGMGMAQAAGVSIEPWDLPWALELANGDQCTLLHGTLTVMAGQTVHYGCADGGMILGETDHSQPVWTVNYLAEGDTASQLVDVVTAWS